MKPPLIEPDPQSEESEPSPHPMTPLDRHRLRLGHPPQAIPLPSDVADSSEWDDAEAETGDVLPLARSSRQDLDPVFGYILAMALSIGLTPVQANLRYVLLWAFLALMGGIAFMLGSGKQTRSADPGDLVWGIGLGVFVGGSLMMVGIDTLQVTSNRLFNAGQDGSTLLNTWVFQATVFVMPISESLFFRGTMQRVHPLPVVAILSSAWSILMFFPNLGLGDTPAVGVVIGVALIVLNFLYSYVHFRNGLAASFFCQMIAGSLLLLVPRIIGVG